MAVELPMFALRSRRACGECKTAEAMRILAIGRWGRVLHHVKCGGGGGGVGVGGGGWLEVGGGLSFIFCSQIIPWSIKVLV